MSGVVPDGAVPDEAVPDGAVADETVASELPGRSRSALRVLTGALSRGGGDRRRTLWVSGAVAGAGAFGCAAASIALLWRSDPPEVCDRDSSVIELDGTAHAILSCRVPDHPGVASYLAEPGLRAGALAAAVFLVVPFLLLLVQVLRFGSAARERRLAGLAVAGAGRAELRRIGALEAVLNAWVGVLLAPVVYLGLWLLVSAPWPASARMLPPDPVGGLLAWPVIAVLLLGVAALAGAVAARPAVLTPVGLVRRGPRPLGRRALVVPAGSVAVVVGSVVALFSQSDAAGWLQGLLVWTVIVAVLVLAVSVSAPLMVLTGRRLVRKGDPLRVLAGRRILAEPRTPGRVAGVLLAAGFAIGIEMMGIGSSLADLLQIGEGEFGDNWFYVGGFGAALAATVLAALVGVLSLVVGAAEQVLDGARPTAALVALGASRADVRAALRCWLRSASTRPIMLGSVLGSAVGVLLLWVRSPLVVLAAVAALGLAALVGALGVALAARLLRANLDASMSVNNLRAG